MSWDHVDSMEQFDENCPRVAVNEGKQGIIRTIFVWKNSNHTKAELT